MNNDMPRPGQWPADPQEDQELLDSRIWIDGCFDFFHHGHAGVILQARQLGTELYIGIHSDEDICEHKGPTVMNLQERIIAAAASRWTTRVVPYSPYVTVLPWISHYGCRYVVHGDDITSDSGGEDCYRFVKAAGRFKVVKRTPGISTTDLVGRMLLCTKSHFVKNLRAVLEGEEVHESNGEKKKNGGDLLQRLRSYASDASGWKPWVDVYEYDGKTLTVSDESTSGEQRFFPLVEGRKPLSGQRVVYVDGGFDLFSSGHIEFLRCVTLVEETNAHESGWYEKTARGKRANEHGEDYAPHYIVVGVHSDEDVNKMKGLNYPIMNLVERGLCVLQCKYIKAVIFSAPLVPTQTYLDSLPSGMPTAIYHGSTTTTTLNTPLDSSAEPHAAAKALGIYTQLPSHEFQDVNAAQIVKRILDKREGYEERQRRKGVKAVGEEVVRRAELGEGRV